MRILVIGSIVFLSILRILTTNTSYPEGKNVRINFRVTKEPSTSFNKQIIYFARLPIYLPLEPPIYYGDIITVEGKIFESKIKDASLVNKREGTLFLFKIRKRIIEFYRSRLPEPHSSLVTGMTLGSKGSIPFSFKQSLINSGTTHVVVASGMNVTLVGGTILAILLKIVNRKKAIAISILCIWVYALLSGFDAPIVRASIMVSLAFLAQYKGRISFSIESLIISVLVMILFRPIWFYDLGLWLSFFATLGLIIFNTKIYTKLYFVPKIFRENLSTTLAAQILVAPLLFVSFGKINLISPFVNCLVLWTIPPITILSLLSGVISLFSTTIASLILYIVYPFTLFFVSLVSLF